VKIGENSTLFYPEKGQKCSGDMGFPGKPGISLHKHLLLASILVIASNTSFIHLSNLTYLSIPRVPH
jgi:hypothetical protein